MPLQQRAALIGGDRVVELGASGLEPLDDRARAPSSASSKLSAAISGGVFGVWPYLLHGTAYFMGRAAIRQASASDFRPPSAPRHGPRPRPQAPRDRSRLRAWRPPGPWRARRRRLEQPLGHPGEIRLDQIELRQRIGAVRVEPRRNQDEFGPECLQRRQDGAAQGLAEFGRARHRPQRHVDDVADAALAATRRCRDKAATDGSRRRTRWDRPRTSPACRCRDGRRNRRWRRARACDDCRARAAPMATLLKRQKPIAMLRLGVMAGRTHGAKGVAGGSLPSPRRPRRPPRRPRAAPPRPSPATGWCRRRSRRNRACGTAAMSASTKARGWTRAISARSAAGAWRWPSLAKAAPDSPSSTAWSRAGRFRMMAAGVVRETSLVGHQQRGHAGKCRITALAPPMGRTGLVAKRAAQ